MMISRRNFAMLTAIILVVLFLFQATGVAKSRLNDAQTNEYAMENRSGLKQEDAFSTEKKTADAQTDRLVVFVGDAQTSRVADTVRQWCTYSKRALVEVPAAADCEQWSARAEAFLIDSGALDLTRDVAILQGYVDAGMNLVFCNLPSAQQISENVELEELLGILAVYDAHKELTGVQLFDGFLLGGEYIYKAVRPEEKKLQDLDLTVPWYLTLNGNKTYVTGLVEDMKSQDGEMDNEYAPSLIWRHSEGQGGAVFAVNGKFLEDVTGIGILEAMICEMHDYEIYPVVNAQNFSVVNYPSFADENTQTIRERYSRDLTSLYRDIIWQSISTVTERSHNKTTALLTPQYDYADENEPSGDAFTYYARLFRENRMELGLSLEQVSDVALADKVERDLSFLNENLSGYEYRSVYVPGWDEESRRVLRTQDGLETITTVLMDYDDGEPLLSYADGLCVQHATHDAFSHTYSEDLRMRAVESAIGYTSVILNMNRAAYPQTDADNWEHLYDLFASYLLTCWNDYTAFDKTTLSESDVRVRRFLNLDFEEQRTGDEITVDLTNFEHAAFFVLRTHGENVSAVQDGSFLKLEEDAYLIQANAKKIVISLENERSLEYY